MQSGLLGHGPQEMRGLQGPPPQGTMLGPPQELRGPQGQQGPPQGSLVGPQGNMQGPQGQPNPSRGPHPSQGPLPFQQQKTPLLGDGPRPPFNQVRVGLCNRRSVKNVEMIMSHHRKAEEELRGWRFGTAARLGPQGNLNGNERSYIVWEQYG